MSPTLEELRARQTEVSQEGVALANSMGDAAPSDETLGKLKELDDEFQTLDTQIRSAAQTEEQLGRFRSHIANQPAGNEGEGGPPGAYTPGATTGQYVEPSPVTWGELFVRSGEYAGWMKAYPSGGPAKGSAQSESMELGAARHFLGIDTATDRMRGSILTPAKFEAMTQDSKYRALVTSADASAGLLVRPDYRGLLSTFEYRPLKVRQLVTTIPVTTDAIEYIIEASRISNAAPVAEATAATGATGLKPEGGLTFSAASDTVKTIAEWVPATRRILSDAPALRGYIDEYLTDDIALELEDQIVAGSGVGENFRGLLNTVGIQTAGPPPATPRVDQILSLFRVARRLININGRTNPTGVLINPVDSETIDLGTWGGATTPTGYMANNGPFGAQGVARLWGVPVVESEAVPAGTALMGDFRRAVLFDRESTNISVGTINDDFVRNIVRVLAEMRAGFGVIRPAAFVAIDLTP